MTQQYIGKSPVRVDALAKVTGAAIYPGDRAYDGELWMKIRFAGRPHARILGIDTRVAEALPGVVAVLTARDVPVNEYGLQTPDQPVLCGPGSAKPGADVVRFVGDQVALVIAESEQVAAHACDLIKIKWQDLPVLTEPLQARQPDAPPLHPHQPQNIAYRQQVIKGNVDAAWQTCDVIVEETYHTPAQEHIYLQPEAGSAYIDDEGRITVHVAGQWAWEDQQQIAHALDLPPERIRVIYDAIGGAFGGREDMSVQIVLALAVMRLAERGIRRPIRIIWSRTESILGHCKRHAMVIRSRWGAMRDGTLVAAEVEIISDAGAYMYTSNKVLGNCIIACVGPYKVPHVRINGYAVYTNNIPGGAFRGFGAPQGLFAAETQMNKLAAVLGMSPVEIRMKNLLEDGDLLSVGTPLPGHVSLKDVVQAAACAGGWLEGVGSQESGVGSQKSEPRASARGPQPVPAPLRTSARLHVCAPLGCPFGMSPLRGEKQGTTAPLRKQGTIANTTRRQGRGLAAGFKNIGFSFGYQENSWARVVLEGETEIEQATLTIGGADVGQGHHTVMAQIAAEALNIPMERIRLVVSDTALTQSSGSSSASRLTYIAGNAVKGAAEQALARWRDEERPAVAEYVYLAPKTAPFPETPGEPFKPNLAYGYLAQSVDLEVDTETGFIHINRVVSVHDVGKAINLQQVVGQVEGGVVQAQGYTLIENFQTKGGYVLTPTMSTYLIPGVHDIPDRVETVIIETPDPDGPYGVRGMAEMPYLGIAPAVIAAVYDATGVWFNDFPLTPERVLKGLGKI